MRVCARVKSCLYILLFFNKEDWTDYVQVFNTQRERIQDNEILEMDHFGTL